MVMLDVTIRNNYWKDKEDEEVFFAYSETCREWFTSAE